MSSISSSSIFAMFIAVVVAAASALPEDSDEEISSDACAAVQIQKSPRAFRETPFKTVAITWGAGVQEQCRYQCEVMSKDECTRYEFDSSTKACKMYKSPTTNLETPCETVTITWGAGVQEQCRFQCEVKRKGKCTRYEFDSSTKACKMCSSPTCSWKPLGSVALQSFHDPDAVDIVAADQTERVEEESACQAICQTISNCVGYSWRSGGETKHKHYRKCFLVSKVGKATMNKSDWFTSALCEQRLQESGTDSKCSAGPKGAHGNNQVPACGCNSSSFPTDSVFCLNGESLTVKKSWDSVIPFTANAGPDGVLGHDQCIGSTIELASPIASAWSLGDKVTLGGCPCSAGPKGAHGNNQVPACGCKSSSFPTDSVFCLNGESLTVKKSWDSVIPFTANAGPDGVLGHDQCIGSTIELASPAATIERAWSLGDKVTLGGCPS